MISACSAGVHDNVLGLVEDQVLETVTATWLVNDQLKLAGSFFAALLSEHRAPMPLTSSLSDAVKCHGSRHVSIESRTSARLGA
jgi:hypothetical protein